MPLSNSARALTLPIVERLNIRKSTTEAEAFAIEIFRLRSVKTATKTARIERTFTYIFFMLCIIYYL